MKWISSNSVKTRLSILIALFSLAATTNILISLNQAATFQVQFSALERRLNALEANRDAAVALQQQETALVRYQLANTWQAYSVAADYYAAEENFQKYKDLEASNYRSGVGNKELRDQLLRSADQLATTVDQQIFYEILLDDFVKPVPGEGKLYVFGEGREQFGQVAAAVDAYAAAHSAEARTLLDQMQRQVETATTVSRYSLYVLLVLLLLSMFLFIDITEPLQTLTSAIIAFENGFYRRSMIDEIIPKKDEIGQLAYAVDRMATSISEASANRERFLSAASRFIPTQYLEFLQKPDLTAINLGDHVSAEMTVLFSDIRGFTSLSEKMTPQQNFDFINEYLKLVSPMIEQNDGFIVKFLGDGMMAIFPYGVDDAVYAGVAKQRLVLQFNETLRQRGFDSSINVGIGIHTGHMMVGMIGEAGRMQGDAFSDNVNLTSRIEGLNKYFGTSVIISQETYDLLPQPFPVQMRYLGKVVVKGRVTPLGLYEIYEGYAPQVIATRSATQADFVGGVALFQEGRFAEAGQAFDRVLQVDPQDQAARLYLELCADWLTRPLPPEWRGAVIMANK